MKKVVQVRCRLSRGGFANEGIFAIASPEGGEFVGTAPLHYCRDSHRNKFAHELREEVNGFVIGVVIGTTQDGRPRVYLPDSEVYDLSDDVLEIVEDSNSVPVRA